MSHLYQCDDCQVEYSLDYDDMVLEEEPTFCPFCGDINITPIEDDEEDYEYD